MFFALLCLLLTVLLLTGRQPDSYGWMMLIGLAWLTGYLDCRRFHRSDQDRARVMPPDAPDTGDVPDDAQIFRT
jgi:hypothetical protein